MMYVLEWFQGQKIRDSLFAFSLNELEENKVKLIKKSNKNDKIYISQMNNDYSKDRLLSKITKIT